MFNEKEGLNQLKLKKVSSEPSLLKTKGPDYVLPALNFGKNFLLSNPKENPEQEFDLQASSGKVSNLRVLSMPAIREAS